MNKNYFFKGTLDGYDYSHFLKVLEKWADTNDWILVEESQKALIIDIPDVVKRVPDLLLFNTYQGMFAIEGDEDKKFTSEEFIRFHAENLGISTSNHRQTCELLEANAFHQYRIFLTADNRKSSIPFTFITGNNTFSDWEPYSFSATNYVNVNIKPPTCNFFRNDLNKKGYLTATIDETHSTLFLDLFKQLKGMCSSLEVHKPDNDSEDGKFEYMTLEKVVL